MIRRMVVFAWTVCVVAVVGEAQDMGARLTDGAATFDYTFGGSSPLPVMPPVGAGDVAMNFQLDGFPGDPSEQQVDRGNWWYRVAGDSRERYFGNPSSRFVVSDYAHWRFDDVYDSDTTTVPNVYAEMDFRLISYGPNSATVRSGLCFFNQGSAPLDVEAFFAVDIDLDATAAGDIYDPTSNAGGRLLEINDGGAKGLFFGQAAIGSGAGFPMALFGALNDFGPDTFSPDLNPFGGNFGAAVLQWHFTVDPGATPVCVPAVLAVGRNGEEPILPEPGGDTHVWLAMGMVLCRRRWLRS